MAANQRGGTGAARRAAVALLLLAAVAVPSPQASAAPDPSFTFGAAGDFGYGANAQAVMAAAGTAGLDFFLALGDTTYAQATEAAWCSAFKAQVPDLLIQAGNHDTGEDAGANLNALLAECPYTLAENMTGSYGREWYFDYPASAPLARFILTGCGVNFVVDGTGTWACAAGDAHYTFVEDAIDGARSAGIQWTIVAMHKNCLSIGAKICEIGTAITNLLLDKRVDLILQGHDHVYARSKQVACASPNQYRPVCVADEGVDGRFTQGAGTVLIVNGMGGRSPYGVDSADSEAPYFAEMFNTSWGFSKFVVNATEIRVDFVAAVGADADAFVIEAAGTPDTTPPPLVVTSPANGSYSTSATVRVEGTTEPGAAVDANGVVGLVALNGSFSFPLALVAGPNAVTVTARDAAGNLATQTLQVTVDDPLPPLLALLSNATLALANVTAELDAAHVQLESALYNVSALRAQGNATQADLDDARADLEAALADVTALEADLAASAAAAGQALALANAAQANLTAAQAELVAARAEASAAIARADLAQANLTATHAQVALLQQDLDAAQAEAEQARAAADAAAGTAATALLMALAAFAVALVAMLMFLRKRNSRE